MRKVSDEAVPGHSVVPSREDGVSGNFWGSQEGCQGPFRPSGRNRGLPLRPRPGQGPHLAKRWEPRGFSRVAAGISSFAALLSSRDAGLLEPPERAAVPVWGFHEVGRGAQGASRVAPGKLGFNGHGEGNASLPVLGLIFSQ